MIGQNLVRRPLTNFVRPDHSPAGGLRTSDVPALTPYLLLKKEHRRKVSLSFQSFARGWRANKDFVLVLILDQLRPFAREWLDAIVGHPDCPDLPLEGHRHC